MFLAQILFGLLTTWCTVHAITVPVDRADVQISPTRSSMIANGWRPLTGYENRGTNVSPSSTHDRNAPHHPVLGKLHEHMQQASSEKVKPQTNNKNSNPQEYSPPTILGSFSVFGHAATKARPKLKEHPKQLTSATTHYSFLIPPPRDSFRFEIDPHRKTNVRDNEAFLRQPSSISQGHQADINSSPFFSKGSGFTSTTTHSPSFSKSRPFMINGINGYQIQQGLHPPRQNQPQQFEVQKASNTKSYLQPPGLENLHNFGKDNANSDSVAFGRFQNQPHSSQIANGGAGNFYSQVDHPPPFKSTFERDPSFLVHESHEISYVTPPSSFNYNFRPSLPYDNLVPPNLFASTSPTKVEVTKFGTAHSGGLRNDHYKQFAPNTSPEESLIKAQGLSHGIPAGTYYLHGEQRPVNSWPQQKSKFTTEINEVLPRKNPPAKFRTENRPNPAFEGQSQGNNQPEVYIIRPSVQQQFDNPIMSQTHQTTSSEPDYETPESISLKHFNEQQFLLQQQLVQQDRQRLQELELQRQRELQRQQEEELRKRQEEIRLFEQQEKQAEETKREEQIKQQKQQQEEQEQQQLQEQYELRRQQEMQEEIERRKEQQAREELEQRKQEQLRQQVEEQKKIQEQQFAIEQQEYNRPPANQGQNPPQKTFQPAQQTSESALPDSEIKKVPEQSQQEVQSQAVEPEVRPYRPKFPQRGPARRRRPLNPAYVAPATEATVQEAGTYQTLTDAPVQTTVEPEVTTVPIPVTLRPRVRRPGQTLKRRRPFSTTPTPRHETSSVTTSSIREPETSSRYQVLDTDFSKRRRPRPTQSTQSTVVTEETATERHYIRKRPSGHRQRVNPGEPFEAEVVTEIVRPTRIIYKDTTEWENYPESFKKKDSQEIDTSSLPSQPLVFNQEMEQASTENSQIFEFSTEPVVPEEVTAYEEQIRPSRPAPSHDEESNIPLEQLFEKPEENHVEPVTTPEDISVPDPTTTTTTTTTTTSTTTTTEIPSTTTEVTSTTRQSHRIRPLKYGNATRPRFSIKDYKSRLDYKNRLSQASTSEAPPVSLPSRRRFTTEKPEETSAGLIRETTSRYKYMSRAAYKLTTSSPATSNSEDDVEEPTTERPNRFKPKRKYNMNLYRSRVTATTPQSNKMSQEDNKQSTTRPENIYSSAIRRARPSQRNRNQPEVTPTEEATEMTAEETSFYSSMTTPHLEESPGNESIGNDENVKEIANEVIRKETGGNKIDEDAGLSEATTTTVTLTRRVQEDQEEGGKDSQTESIPTIPTGTEPNRDVEDALISQRIANLTSSASELYEPGMFKAVSPATESRVINPHFAIATDEPTLPIEAFFQVMAKKDE